MIVKTVLTSSNRILQLLNKRYLEKLKEDWWKDKKTCEKVEDQSDGISIQNIGGVFIVIFVGIGMACVTLVFEYWWYKYRKTTPKIFDVAESMSSKADKRDKKIEPSVSFGNNGGEIGGAGTAAATTAAASGDDKNFILRPRKLKF